MNEIRKLAKASETPDQAKALRALEQLAKAVQAQQDRVLVAMKPSEVATVLGIGRSAATYRRQHAARRLAESEDQEKQR